MSWTAARFAGAMWTFRGTCRTLFTIGKENSVKKFCSELVSSDLVVILMREFSVKFILFCVILGEQINKENQIYDQQRERMGTI